ncbi:MULTISPECIES: N-acetylmuramoyl-L-alanine amidase [unclassified Crossiella]|uniref:N-acetylmuramoyl-L-alanine amidase n=1 Tax=unclassified Crossiella TaxID=2620835 RepID=UPI001FFF3FE8|nr:MULTISPECIES: N-acetylmuramoyl-L-alanine amidase [unclassified Crossiella]MCK2242136.1 N-acetylmuramoyl-L-alanine amidase [Crossiella sp. S99.2]MCK2256039.1 N-acetylmuramoyl-L-alanine amidase [Crossiella sp. S99.1]
MIASPHHSGRGGARVRLVVVHTAEGARTVEALGRFFQGKTQASSHVGIDDHRIEQYVPYDRAAWTLRSGNPVSDNAELCGFARWDRAEWLRHPRMLDLTAAWIWQRCSARGIPIRKLTPAQVAAGESGVCGHHDWTEGMKEGSHWDPGPHFPWDLVMAKAGDSTGGDDVSYDDAYRAIRDVLNEEFANPNESGRNTTLRQQIAHCDWRADHIVGQLAPPIGEVLGLLRPGGFLAALIARAAENDDVDEAELARNINWGTVSSTLLSELATATANELDRRARVRLDTAEDPA